MKDDITEEQSNAILKALDEAIANGPWEDSNFLRVIGKNLRQIRENFVNEVYSDQTGKSKVESKLVDRASLHTGQQEVFVSLYTTGGGILQNWERVIANLPRQVVSRPVYAEEINVKNLIKAKENKINEGYVAIFINQSDILTVPSDKIALDRFGKPLMTLKDKAITLANISRFVHSSGIYNVLKGRLVKKSSNEV